MTASDTVFAAKVNQFLLAQAVRVYIANEHQGTSSAQTRSDVTRTKKKWFKQKGTGNARHGARSANIFVGGGAAHGPKQEQHLTLTLSKQQKKKALISALSLRVEDVLVCNAVSKLEGKTKDAKKLLDKISPESKKIVIVMDEISDLSFRSLRNIPEIKTIEARRLNALDVVDTQQLIMTKTAVKVLETRLVNNKQPATSKKKSPTSPRLREAGKVKAKK